MNGREWPLRPMTLEDLDVVMPMEQGSHAHPWTVGQMSSSIQVGHWAQVLVTATETLGYVVAMRGVQEWHLLNVTVSPRHRRLGHATTLLQALIHHAAADGAQALWLEVRASNVQGLALYRRMGFEPRGVRKGYYPAGRAAREDAVVMARDLATTGDLHAA
jgi:[ribosomal protein S18]-alanine N-acetyltransferase